MLVSVKIGKNIMCVEKMISWNPAMCSYQNVKYVGSIIFDSVITCDEIIEKTKTVSTKRTSTNLYILLAFLLTPMALLIVVFIVSS